MAIKAGAIDRSAAERLRASIADQLSVFWRDLRRVLLNVLPGRLQIRLPQSASS
ncbi:hypothetical protein [Sphingomonas sp. 3-13AW]|uniref:hypothetical protein n=1 Tax=Sphingomonas sp. 3-13AW TaxID=3050450 RepID=UPI003BB79F38